MLKVIMLRIAAFITFIAGFCGFAVTVTDGMAGTFEVIGIMTIFFACYMCATYLGVKADDIDYEIHHHGVQ